jgi:putative ABC transport system permease protein
MKAMLFHDLRCALRTLLQTRGVTLIAVLALALGIGANTAIFSVVHAVLLSPLPYRDPDRLVTMLQSRDNPVSPADFLDVREQARSFERVGAAELWGASLTGRDAPEQIVGMHMSEDMFPLLGATPAQGRTFDAADFGPGKDHVIVLGYALWQRSFGGAPGVVGQKILLDNESYTVIGIMPPRFFFAPFWVTQAEMWVPMDLSSRLHLRNSQSLRVFARLKPGVAIAQAQAEVGQIAHALEVAYPDSNTGRRLMVSSLTEQAVGNLRPALEVLLGAVGMVLLIACANVANLALARATARQKEIAVRLALGAQRMRIARQFLTESIFLAFTGGALGLILAAWGTRALQAMIRPDAGSFHSRLPRWDQIGLDVPVLVFTLALALATGVLFGIVPALTASRGGVNDALKEGGRGSPSGSGARFRRTMVAAEIAIALVLLIGAGLLMRSFLRLRAIDPGFDPHNLLTMTVSVAGRPEYVGASREALYRNLVERIEAVPGVRQASVTNHLPLAGDIWGQAIAIEGRPVAQNPAQEINSIYRDARPNYFSTMGAHFLKGRDFNDRDIADAPPVVIINETLAKHEFANEDPIGKRLTLGDPLKNPRWRTIIGVIKDVKQTWTGKPNNEFYLAFVQDPTFYVQFSSMTLVVRTDIDASTLTRSVKSAVWSVDRNLPLSEVQTLEHAIGNATWQTRFSLLLVGLFSALALVLAMIGIYGVMAYEVAQRTQEIGIRMALGAARRGIVLMIARQSLTVALIGIACGLAAAAGLVRLMKAMLYQVDVLDPATFAGVALLVLVVAAVAAVIPARSAMNVDPMIALRRE